jgi:hypothetical protein
MKLESLLPYLFGFILGLIVASQGCGEAETITKVVEKPIPKIEYVDRWRTDTVRFVSKQFVTIYDTIYSDRVVSRLDTLFMVDTVKIVDTWLSEVVRYDTTAPVLGGVLRLRWQNYQNLTENLRVDYTPRKVPLTWVLGVHGNVGMLSDFNTRYTPLFGIGAQVTVRKTYISANYGFNGQHYVGVGVGYNIISR